MRHTHVADLKPAAGPPESGYRLVDCDVHPIMKGGMGDLRPYLSAVGAAPAGARRAPEPDDRRAPRAGVHPAQHALRQPGRACCADDARAPDGVGARRRPGVHRRAAARRQRYRPRRAHRRRGARPRARCRTRTRRRSSPRRTTTGSPSTWLSADDRFRGNLVVGPQDPALAAKEIRRAGADQRFVAVLLPLTNILMGQRHYYPIYEAAAELGLPITVHPNSGEGIFRTSPSHGRAARRPTTSSGTPA